MPTFDEALAAVHLAIVRYAGRPPSVLRDREPFAAVAAVTLMRAGAQGKWQALADALRDTGLLVPETLAAADLVELRDALLVKGRPLRLERLAPLKRLARWLLEHHGGNAEFLASPHYSTGWLRGELSRIRGISDRDADSILLLALERPSYPVDRATYRVLVRHGWIDPTASYDEARDLLVDAAVGRAHSSEKDAARILAEVAYGMEQIGRRFCRAAAPHCEHCPLANLLPDGGPRATEC
jgi:endonuclease-3 related protein